MDHRDGNVKEIAVLRGAVENSNEAFITIDRNHQVLFFNKAAERIFGFQRDEVIGHDLNVIMSPQCSHDHRKAVEQYLLTRTPKRIGHETELLAIRKSGAVFPASISFSVSEVEGELYFTGIVRDLTETKSLQQRIMRSERLVALGQLVAEITHEIKNPLMVIGGLASQLSRQLSRKNEMDKLDIIVKEVSRLESLLKELREFYLPRSLSRVEVDVHGFLNEMHDLFRDEYKKKGILPELIAEDARTFIHADRERLKQVFINVIKNALESMEKGGKLSLRSSVKGEKVEITIMDNGCGIPEKNMEKIFTPFFTTKEGGTGLGLGISRSIVEDHGKSAFVIESQEGKGTKVKITMPLYRAIAHHEENGRSVS